jgi:hypothetical protein
MHRLALVPMLAVLTCACSSDEQAIESAPAQSASSPSTAADVGPGPGNLTKPQVVLRGMCETLTRAEAFRFKTENTMDEMLESGQMVQFASSADVIFRRPNHFRVDGKSDFGDERIWCDGTQMNILNVDRNRYATIDVPDTAEAMFEMLIVQYGSSIPLADLFAADPYPLLTQGIRAGYYVGKAHVGSHVCHHLAFRQDTLDWQIWVDTGEQAVPRQVVITYKDVPGDPQYVATLDQWDFTPTISDKTFQFKAPSDATKVAMEELDLP